MKKLLRHKRIENTLKHTHLVHFEENDFHVATATTVEEIKKLAEAGFQKFDEISGVHIFRRPKRFGNAEE